MPDQSVLAQNFSVTYPFLIDYDRVESVVIYEGFRTVGTDYTACANMIPPPPDFPSDWSAMIEANFVDRGLTFTMRQLYSQSLNKVGYADPQGQPALSGMLSPAVELWWHTQPADAALAWMPLLLNLNMTFHYACMFNLIEGKIIADIESLAKPRCPFH